MPVKVKSMVKVDDEWVEQEELPEEEFQEILMKVMRRAAEAIGMKVEKTAGNREK